MGGREPGNYGDPFGVRMYDDEMRNKEINNGRFAMICVLGIFAAELATGKDAISNSASESCSSALGASTLYRLLASPSFSLGTYRHSCLPGEGAVFLPFLASAFAAIGHHFLHWR